MYKLLFSHFGGKKNMFKEIVSRLDYSKGCYVELFGGSAQILINKPPHKIEIINDIDDDIFTLWKVVKENPKALMNELKNVLYSRKVFKYYKKLNPKNDLEKAVKCYVLYNFSVLSSKSSFAVSIKTNHPQTYRNRLEIIPLIYERFSRAYILNDNYSSVLELIKDETDIMLYADPPYWGTEYYYKNSSFKKEDHYKLAEYLNNAKYSVMISYYYFDEIEKLYPQKKWIYHRFRKQKNSYSFVKTTFDVEELLLCNYNTELALM